MTAGMDMMQPLERIPAPFDYAQLEPEIAQEARSIATRYCSRVQAYVIDTGRDLLAMKERLEHGQFLEWVKSELELTPRTVQNFMQAAEQLGHKSEIVSHLPPTTLYRLAAPSTPAHLREDVVRRLEAHEPLPARAIDRLVDEAKEQARQQAAQEKENKRWASTLEQQAAEANDRKSRARLKAEREARLERQWQEHDEKSRIEAAAKEEAARFLVETMREHLPRFIQLVDASGFPHAVFTRVKELGLSLPTFVADLPPPPAKAVAPHFPADAFIEDCSGLTEPHPPEAEAALRVSRAGNVAEPFLPFGGEALERADLPANASKPKAARKAAKCAEKCSA